jgi:nitrogen-specific signal transduction histidine kinase
MKVGTERIREIVKSLRLFSRLDEAEFKPVDIHDGIDNGIGIPSHIKEKIFDPFFTTKPVGKGTGMGMSISYQIIVKTHNGTLECFSDPKTGTDFQIRIPIQQH